MSLTDSFETLADPEMMQRTAAVGGGYLGASLAQSSIDPMLPLDVPNEAYGVGTAAAAMSYSPMFGEEMALGGAVYTLDALAQRFGVKKSINQAAPNGGD
jgi:hypothetical protein